MGIPDLTVKLFLDSARLADVAVWAPRVAGFTTNPTLMREAGVDDYLSAARALLEAVGRQKPVSLEVIADDFDAMHAQALRLAALSPNVYVKIPITDTRGASSGPLIRRLSRAGVRVNVTAILTARQAQAAAESLFSAVPSIVSIFAGRIADTGRDPSETIRTAVLLAKHAGAEVLWASAREALNVYQADALGCDIITLTPALLGKLPLRGKDLDDHSLDIVRMFYYDAVAAGLKI